MYTYIYIYIYIYICIFRWVSGTLTTSEQRQACSRRFSQPAPRADYPREIRKAMVIIFLGFDSSEFLLYCEVFGGAIDHTSIV